MKPLIIILLAPLLSFGQTSQLNFVYKNGVTVGRSMVMDLPVTLFSPGTPQGQLLIFYPPAYKAGKLCGLFIFHPGDGEQTSLDITQANKNSLPRMIAAGLTPYSMLPNADTLWWVVVSIHSNAGSAYRSQQAQILPWIWDKSGIKYDPKHVWITGLSGGGSATNASVMIDTTLSKRITGIMPLANGGYDDFYTKLQGNLIKNVKNGLYCFWYIGNQDPGYNGTGFFPYDALWRTYALPDHYHQHVIPGGTHSANVWDVPFNSRQIWDSLGIIGFAPIIPPPKLVARINIDSTTIHSPNSFVRVNADSSQGLISSYQWLQVAGPTGAIFTSTPGTGMLFSGLFPGSTYLFELYLNDRMGNVDSAFVNVEVMPIIIPPPRRVTNFGLVLINGAYHVQFTYSDGTIETL